MSAYRIREDSRRRRRRRRSYLKKNYGYTQEMTELLQCLSFRNQYRKKDIIKRR
jgi:hypothetical protein